ncbi:hypothetical protein GPECTOR_54g243 [Gonium pectorale]|uniref:S-adenosyl-L-methionine-dependent methyltransferase n=1 Tax=Gonium pectorale TaxID=33097 RepID=A0A150G6Q0_GONPE|nr:hypothetical protein GPECTOR_54g243 [Gonium pectorale]|eukprot:KXZ45501.1 hypothetical protein GPECTOR_54g243 [Gonium pectorale]
MSVATDAGVGTAPPARDAEPEPEVYSDRWEMIWSSGLGRGQRWDASTASPALVDLLRKEQIGVLGKRVLVPGCGRGYDLPVFLSSGATEVVGLELSETAAREADGYLQEVRGTMAGADGGQLAGSMRITVGDFFTWTGSDGDGYDVGYDYTFGCAMHPTMRQDWATHWARHLRPGGCLVALVFPIRPTADPNVGPPFPVSPQLYTELLVPKGFECIYSEPVPAELSHPSRAGQEVMTIWRKQ